MTCKDKKTRVSLLVVPKAALPFSPTYLSSKNAMNSPACNILQLSDSINYFKASLELSRAERRGEASEAKDKPNCAYRARASLSRPHSAATTRERIEGRKGRKRVTKSKYRCSPRQHSKSSSSSSLVSCARSDSGRCQNQSASNAIQISKRRGARARAHTFDLTSAV